MKNLSLSITFLLAIVAGVKAQNIIPAKNAGQGATITISGTVINGAELGGIRYIQDATGGIAAFPGTGSVGFSPVRGDSVRITGDINPFQGLIEVSPVTAYTRLAQNRTLPTPTVVTPSQLSASNDAQLVRINNVVFSTPGVAIVGGNSYNFTSGGQSGSIFVRAGNPLVGTTLPLAPATLTGINSTHLTTFQILPRDTNDIQITATLFFTGNVTQTNIATTSFDLNWGTNSQSSTGIRYGLTPALELGTLYTHDSVTTHLYSLTGLLPATAYYVQAFSVSGTDTATSTKQVFSTASNSTGVIRVYFNQAVDNSVSSGTNAIHVGNIEDTIVAYINLAQTSLDVMSYNITSTKIVDAINAAYTRGVRVRFVSDSTTSNTARGGLNNNIHILEGNVGGIMHAKVLIIDANSVNNSWIYAGSCNYTSQNMFQDYNNILFIQDQALARAYTMEFNEMWGDTGVTPNQANKRFGNLKTNNTPHDFMIGGKHVEMYFSPSDNTTSHINNVLLSANHDVHFAVLTFTRNDLGDALVTDKNHGVTVSGMIENVNDAGSEYAQLVQDHISVVAHCLPNDLHHKYAIVDEGMTSSDPTVATGSHNWSTAAETVNDEDELIIHDATIANLYLQEWTATYNAITVPAVSPVVQPLHVNIPGAFTLINFLDHTSDANCQLLTVTITGGHTRGTFTDNHDGTGIYSPISGVAGPDTIFFDVCDPTGRCTHDTAYLTLPIVGIENVNALVKSISLYPNPTNNDLNIGLYVAENAAATIVVTDVTGTKVMSQNMELLNGQNTLSLDVNKLASGLYFITVQANGESVTRKFSKQ